VRANDLLRRSRVIRAWKELHAISGLRMNADDEEWLDERLEMLDADDEGDED